MPWWDNNNSVNGISNPRLKKLFGNGHGDAIFRTPRLNTDTYYRDARSSSSSSSSRIKVKTTAQIKANEKRAAEAARIVWEQKIDEELFGITVEDGLYLEDVELDVTPEKASESTEITQEQVHHRPTEVVADKAIEKTTVIEQREFNEPSAEFVNKLKAFEEEKVNVIAESTTQTADTDDKCNSSPDIKEPQAKVKPKTKTKAQPKLEPKVYSDRKSNEYKKGVAYVVKKGLAGVEKKKRPERAVALEFMHDSDGNLDSDRDGETPRKNKGDGSKLKKNHARKLSTTSAGSKRKRLAEDGGLTPSKKAAVENRDIHEFGTPH